MRYIYALINGLCYRKLLSQIVKDPSLAFDTVLDISASDLKKLGVELLVLDFDGVLNSHGEVLPQERVVLWLQKMVAELGAERVVILSNKPLSERVRYFNEVFKGVEFIAGVRKKPYPDGLIKIHQLKQVPLENIALVDDRILTGLLATQLAKCKGIYIKKPYRNFKRRPIKEAFFAVLRWAEKKIMT